MFGPEAALESHEEVLRLLGIRGVDAPHKFLQGSIKRICALITYLRLNNAVEIKICVPGSVADPGSGIYF